MEGTSVIPPAKRPLDSSTTVRSESNSQNSGRSSKRRSTSSFKSPPLPLTPSSGETLFRILCPSSKTGALIGKSGSIIRRFRSATRAKIRIDDPVPASDERVILIVAPAASPPSAQDDGGGDKAEAAASPAQRALVMLFDRMVEVDEEEKDGVAEAVNKGIVVCRLLAPSNQVGCVLGKGGKIVEKIREESGAQVRVLAKDQIPACAAMGDELIQITGSVSSVRKALLSVSSCLQDNPRSDATNFAGAKSLGVMLRGAGPAAQVDPFHQRGYVPSPRSLDYHSRGYSSVPGLDSAALGHRQVLEEEVVFRLLCSNDKVGSLIGKGGTIVRGLQNETGASIKVLESVPDSEERVVVISTLENSELKRSPAQDALIRAHSRIAETGAEKGVPFTARLLVPSQQIGCLLGKGGSIIAEMRRVSGASIKILVNEQVPKCAMPNDEVVQVADMHYGNGVMTRCRDVLASEFRFCSDLNTTRFVRRMIDVEKPDFIAFTGDNIFGSSTSDAAESLIRAFVPAVESKLPWAAVLGNHDQESTMTREELMSFISLMDYSVSQVNPFTSNPSDTKGVVPEIDGFGNYNIRVHGALGSDFANTSILNLYFLDSGDRATVGGIRTYGWIKESQLRWLRSISEGFQVQRRFLLRISQMQLVVDEIFMQLAVHGAHHGGGMPSNLPRRITCFWDTPINRLI